MKGWFATVITVMSTLGAISPLSGQARPTIIAERGYVSAMKSDLRTLATAEEAYFVDHNGEYFAGTVDVSNPLFGFSPSANVKLNPSAMGASKIVQLQHTEVACSE